MSEHGQLLVVLLGALFVLFTLGGEVRSSRGWRRRSSRPLEKHQARRSA